MVDKKKNPDGRIIIYLLVFLVFIQFFSIIAVCNEPVVKLGNEVLLENYYHVIEGKRVGLITNQTGVDSKGISFIDNLLATKG
ncbi:MAG: hypothetical protein R6U91_03795 [Bacillota bacterium]